MGAAVRSSEAARKLVALFREAGYVRTPDPERCEREDSRSYKKGWEVRLVVSSKRELDQARSLLRQCGFRVPKAWMKSSRYVQPVYGEQAVAWFQRGGR